MAEPVDVGRLREWVGRRGSATDLVTPGAAERFEAMLDLPPREFRTGDPLPLGMHWCIAPPLARASALGRDGHPRHQGFMPPVPLPRRMWAGGEIAFREPLRVGIETTRRSTVASVDLKAGRTGPLVLLRLAHAYTQEGREAVVETQTLVFREDAGPGAGNPAPGRTRADPEPPGRLVEEISPNPTLLFRYSALTFNGHRIHYDQAYARAVEGYPDIVVHGPLIATLLMRASAAAAATGALAAFAFRGVSPAFADKPLRIVVDVGAASMRATAVGPEGTVMQAEATPATS
jgi:3-methylfumaryl-CoA hydratase